ncbi:50S ribosomal protein L3 [Candidatus Pacearchaeota archaeon]|nr:50S ribosomal protein L3 [Candidatus Pacearchaeota archaeon]MBD3282921.1 50S ribosomal protein L3 [Candidatus Pacearchaeota archaeon]
MPKHSKPRRGSLQFYPRKRSRKILPRVNWDSFSNETGLLGFIGYKIGMKSAYVKDNTPNSLTKGQRITIPVTIIECPTIKILSVRFYKNKRIMGEVVNQNLDKELKKKIKFPKNYKKKIDDFEKEDFEDIRIVVYSQVKKTGIKKTPDIVEIGLSGTKEEKLEFVKNNVNREISVSDIFKEGLVDIRGVTKGKGTQGPTKRFGLTLQTHKTEKGQRGPGSGGPWHPARVEFTQPMAGQMGYFTRVVYNSKIVFIGNISEKNINPPQGFKHFGKINTSYIVLQGSFQGPVKRQLIITPPLRPHKKQIKKNFEFIELR